MTGWDSISATEVTLLVTPEVLEQDFLSMFSTNRMGYSSWYVECIPQGRSSGLQHHHMKNM